jgi:hypothetical protein
MYQLIYSHQDGTVSSIKRNSDGASIPLAEGNMDYQAFLVWNAEQAVPLDLNSISQEMIDAHNARVASQQAKMQAIIDNLPSWSRVSTAVDNISSLAEAKVFIKKLSRIVYWLAKDKEE